jgi:Cft2 family RNA processing exonuclease
MIEYIIDNSNNNDKRGVIFIRTVNILTASIGKYFSEDIYSNKDNKVIEDSRGDRGNKGDNGKGGEDIDQ